MSADEPEPLPPVPMPGPMLVKVVPVKPTIAQRLGELKTLAGHLLSTRHFYLWLLAQLLGVVVVLLHPGGPAYQACMAAIGTLANAGYVLGAKWSPPRRRWTNAERVAHGLQPLPELDEHGP